MKFNILHQTASLCADVFKSHRSDNRRRKYTFDKVYLAPGSTEGQHKSHTGWKNGTVSEHRVDGHDPGRDMKVEDGHLERSDGHSRDVKISKGTLYIADTLESLTATGYTMMKLVDWDNA